MVVRVAGGFVRVESKSPRVANANLQYACARCERRFPRMFLDANGDGIVCRPEKCRPHRNGEEQHG